ncbi:MAG TPA: hypothetical protein VFV08_13375, partial [Puia sp.]|nr:hypothetical protein [Puia sp.]
MIQKALLIIIAFIVAQSCHVGASGIWKNDHIEKEKKAEIAVLDDKLFKAISSNDAAGLKAIMSDSLIQRGGDINKFVSQINSAFKVNSYRIVDQYYVQNTATNLISTIPGISGDSSYMINYLAVNKEMFVSLLLPNGQSNEALILAIYGNYNNKWKLNILKIGQYSLLNKNAIDYYKLALSCYNKKFLIDAYTNINLSERLLKPADTFFEFQKEG